MRLFRNAHIAESGEKTSMIFYLSQSLISIAALWHYRDNRIRYLTMATVAYFMSYLATGEFDISLSLYFAFLVLGIGLPRNIEISSLLVVSWIVLYTIVGVVFQDLFATATALITRFGYIIIFLFMLLGKRTDELWKADVKDYRFLVRTGLITELAIVALVWMQNGIGSRVVAGNQPIGAGIVIGLAAVIGWCYLKKMFTATETVVYCLISAVVTVLSGTRGYMVIIALPLAVVMLAYLFDLPENGKNALIRIGLCCLIAAAAIICLFVVDRGETVIQVLRLDEGLGYRENENLFVKEIMRRAPWYNQLFGFGFGGNASKVNGFLEVVQQASWNREFMFSRLLTRTIFHNYWYTVLFKTGILGVGMIILFYGLMLRKIFCVKGQSWEKWMLGMMVIGNIVSLTFRITATCSIFEMLLVAFFIRQMQNGQIEIRERKNAKKEYHNMGHSEYSAEKKTNYSIRYCFGRTDFVGDKHTASPGDVYVVNKPLHIQQL